MEITPVSPRNAARNAVWLVAALACMTASAGCTSVISSAYLREAWLDAVEHAAETRADAKQIDKEAAPDASDTAETEETDAPSAIGDATADSDAATWSPATLDEAIDEAGRRLVRSGGLNDAARGTLIATLKSTPRQDWPVVVEEFAAALASAHVDSEENPAAAATEATNEQSVHAAASMTTTATNREAAASVSDAEPVAPMPPAESSRDAVPTSDQQTAPAVPAQPVFAVQNACFASRVRAWGVVDRFETSQFQPGQELIVYFELDQLASRESTEGHTTRIDTLLRLVDAGGRRVHEWTFEPLEETCTGHRRDYFARYLVALPAAMPVGSCRLEVVVTDTIAGRTAQATLPLEIVSR